VDTAFTLRRESSATDRLFMLNETAVAYWQDVASNIY